MKKHMVSILCAVCLTASYFSVVRASGCEKGQNSKVLLPPNLILSRRARSLVEKVWRRSPTFRLQCERISQASWLRVKLSFALKTPATERYGARTIVNKRSGMARVEIYAPQYYVEMIGHEFEHLLEQIEGVNLAALVAEDNGQALRQADGAFETARALKAGRKVQAEYIRAKISNDPSEAPCSARAMAGVAGGGRL